MVQEIVAFVRQWPPELATLGLSMVPVIELRGSLPLAITVWGLSPATALFWGVLGSMLPVPFIFWLLPPVVQYVERRFPAVHRIMERYFRALEQKNRASYQRWGVIGLALFVAIPLPGTGAWTAAILTVLFSIKRGPAFLAILSGVLAAGLIILALALGLIRLF